MSMLAERKRKSKWIINPSKKPLWTADSNGINFGKNLMEKMGWSPGKGLGVQEQGISEPLKIAFKNDTKGIGCKGNDEDWIECQDEFNNLLNELANKNDPVGLNSSEKQSNNEIKSLEEKSKQSKARVHYQKFMKSKDLANYSENDLACILGMSQNRKLNETGKKHGELKDIEDKCDKSFGVTTVNGGSLQDYLKKKWITYKSKIQPDQSSEMQNKSALNSEIANNTWKLEGEKKKRKHESVDLFSNDCSEENCVNENEELNCNESSIELGKHKKKKKALELIGDYDNIILKKKKKENTIYNQNLEIPNNSEKIKECEDSELPSKNSQLESTKENFESKKRKRKFNETNEDENLEEKINLRKKKKKSKEIDNNSEREENKFTEEINKKEETVWKKKKKKKKKDDLDMEIMCSSNFVNESIISESSQENKCYHTKKKKKKKKEKTESFSVQQINIDNSEKSIMEEVSLSKKDTSSVIIDIKDTNEIESKEKKRKKKEPIVLKSNMEVDMNLSLPNDEYCKKKKSKKSKNKEVKNVCEDSLIFNSNEVPEPKIKNTDLNLKIKNEPLKTDFESQPKPQRKENKNVMYSHKIELFKKKKTNVYSGSNKRVLQLSFGFEVHKFKGSNLSKLSGYGMKNNGKNIKTR